MRSVISTAMTSCPAFQSTAFCPLLLFPVELFDPMVIPLNHTGHPLFHPCWISAGQGAEPASQQARAQPELCNSTGRKNPPLSCRKLLNYKVYLSQV